MVKARELMTQTNAQYSDKERDIKFTTIRQCSKGHMKTQKSQEGES